MWSDLPPRIQNDLRSIQLSQDIFDGSDPRRDSILRLYGKLKSTMIDKSPLWNYVHEFKHAGVGVLDFSVKDIGHLKQALRREKTFTTPSSSVDKWDSREKCFRNSLHLRHNDKYQDTAEDLTVHIDPIGLYPGSGAWCQPLILLTAPLHLLCYHRYRIPRGKGASS